MLEFFCLKLRETFWFPLFNQREWIKKGNELKIAQNKQISSRLQNVNTHGFGYEEVRRLAQNYNIWR